MTLSDAFVVSVCHQTAARRRSQAGLVGKTLKVGVRNVDHLMEHSSHESPSETPHSLGSGS